MATLYHDNDADLTVKKLPTGLTPNWAVVTDPAAFPVIPVHGSLSGTLTYVPATRSYDDVLEGDAITSHLPPTDEVTGLPVYAIVVWWGANVRKVLSNIIVKRVRE
jgi:hypothetical protein